MFKPAAVLFIITAIAALFLGLAYEITLEPIKQAGLAEKEKALSELLPGASGFKAIPGEYNAGSVIITEILECQTEVGAGYIITTKGKGYGGAITVMTAISNNAIAGASVISHSETPGLGANAAKESFTGRYIAKRGGLSVVKGASSDNEIDAITSATITSKAVTDCVNAAFDYYERNLAEG